MSNSPSATFFEPSNIRCSNRCAKPVRPGRSLAEPDVVPDVDGDDRHARVAMQNHVQAVGQRELAERNLERAPAAQPPGAVASARRARAEQRRVQSASQAPASWRRIDLAGGGQPEDKSRAGHAARIAAHERHGTSFRHRTLARDVLRHTVSRAAAAPFLRAVRAAGLAVLRRRRTCRQSRALLAAARRARRRHRAAARLRARCCAGCTAATTASRSCRWPSAASAGYRRALGQRAHADRHDAVAEWVENVQRDPRFAGVGWARRRARRGRDAAVADRALRRAAFVKVDVEGFEAEVLAGLATPVRALSFEYVPADARDRARLHRAARGARRSTATTGRSARVIGSRARDWLDAAGMRAQLTRAAAACAVGRRLRGARGRLRPPFGSVAISTSVDSISLRL